MIKKYKNKEELLEQHPKTKLINKLDLFLKDLFELEYPKYYKKNSKKVFKKYYNNYLKKHKPNWIYLPWASKAYKLPREKDYLEIITSRNKPYVSRKEQNNFYKFNIGIVGLSTGQSIALTVARSGGCKNMKVADFDRVDPSNLNRVHTGIDSIDKKKTIEVSMKLYEINPYHNIITFNQGINKNNISDFFSKDFKLDLVVDACDDFRIKIALREYAKKNKIPVLMTTDLGDGILIDIERHDLEDTKPFGGRHKKITKEDNFLSAAIKIISTSFLSNSLIESLLEIGNKAPTHPQLANSVYAAGSISSYIIRKISNKQEIDSNRNIIDIDEHLNPKRKTESYKKEREIIVKKINKLISKNETK